MEIYKTYIKKRYPDISFFTLRHNFNRIKDTPYWEQLIIVNPIAKIVAIRALVKMGLLNLIYRPRQTRYKGSLFLGEAKQNARVQDSKKRLKESIPQDPVFYHKCWT